MIFDSKKLASVAQILAKDVGGLYSESGATIGCVNGVYFRLVALDEAEAIATDTASVLSEHCCITE